MDTCDALKVLAELSTRLEKQYMSKGYLHYEHTREIIESIVHEVQVKKNGGVNELKKSLDIYHNK